MKMKIRNFNLSFLKKKKPMSRVDFLMVGSKLGQETIATTSLYTIGHPTLNNHVLQSSQTKVLISTQINLCASL